MATQGENERLAVVETILSTVQTDVADIKKDVRMLVQSNAGSTAIRSLARSAVPFVALGVSIAALMIR